MEVFRINGGRSLRGTVTASGAKNSALPIFAAALLTSETVIIEGVPDLSDVRFMGEILSRLGATVERPDANTWKITARDISSVAPYDLVRKMRASVCLLGPLTGRMRKARVSIPGGCVIGPRPIDLHLKGLARLGCRINVESGYVNVDASGLRGDYLFLGGRHGSTVTGTANMIMAAVLAPGTTRLESAAVEPEVVDLCEMLVKMGAKIEGVGSHYLKIHGVESLGGCSHRIIPDRIEAGTYLIAGAMTEGDLTVENVVSGHLRALLDKLEEAGIPCAVEPDARRIRVLGRSSTRRSVDIVTLPFPGFPTDLQAQMCALMALTPGLSIVTERIYPNRFMHVPELGRMGADIAIEGANAIIHGRARFSGAPVMASDLRASAALVLAALAAEGETWIQRIYHLDRGYDRMDEKLNGCGAAIERLPASAMPSDLLED
jgi:UDP-N-acetylglucosamine 1-carboxyvinyltransferase